MPPLAWQLMAELQRLRAGDGPLAHTARHFVQAIDASMAAAGGARRSAAASRYRIAASVLDALDALDGVAGAALPAGEARRIRAMLPEIVRQVARVEAGQPVATLCWGVQGSAAPCGI